MRGSLDGWRKSPSLKMVLADSRMTWMKYGGAGVERTVHGQAFGEATP